MTGKEKGKFYFISRLTTNTELGDVNFGDRTLANFLGDDGYLFITNDQKSKNPNVYQSVAHEDIEGLWTYVYFSYSKQSSKVVGFLKYGDQAAKRVEFNAAHPDPKFLRFILGG